jgi:hypothetical protein
MSLSDTGKFSIGNSTIDFSIDKLIGLISNTPKQCTGYHEYAYFIENTNGGRPFWIQAILYKDKVRINICQYLSTDGSTFYIVKENSPIGYDRIVAEIEGSDVLGKEFLDLVKEDL